MPLLLTSFDRAANHHESTGAAGDRALFGSLGGLYIHKDTPERIIKVLHDALRKAYEDKSFKDGIENLGEEARFEEAEFNREYIRKAEEAGVPVLKSIGLYVGR